MRYTKGRVASILRGQGYRLTNQRRAVLDTISVSHEHLTPFAIYERVHQAHPEVGLVTIYRTLDLLADLGLICEVNTENGRSYLMRRPEGHHHHLICSDCGSVVDFADCNISELEKRLMAETGFKIQEHRLEFYGNCPECREKATAKIRHD